MKHMMTSIRMLDLLHLVYSASAYPAVDDRLSEQFLHFDKRFWKPDRGEMVELVGFATHRLQKFVKSDKYLLEPPFGSIDYNPNPIGREQPWTNECRSLKQVQARTAKSKPRILTRRRFLRI